MAESAHLDHNVDTWPSWGSLAIDPFMIENWNPSSDKSDEDQRLALVREFVRIGSRERKQYAERAVKGTVRPTDDQVATILHPLRSPVLRYVATKLDGKRGDEPERLWLRTDYGDEKLHKTLCENVLASKSVDSGEALHQDSTILSDSRYYNFSSWREVLDVLPEIVADQRAEQRPMEDFDSRDEEDREQEREYMNESDEEMQETLLAEQQYSCCARYFIVEDQELHATQPPQFHALWLDDRGNVVRENRITTGQASTYPTMAAEAMGSEDEIWLQAEIGPKYKRGAEFGPPFSV